MYIMFNDVVGTGSILLLLKKLQVIFASQAAIKTIGDEDQYFSGVSLR